KKRDRSAKTVDEAFGKYLQDHVEPNRSEHATRSSKRVRRMIKKSLGSKYIALIDLTDVKECLRPYHNQRGNYNLIRTYLSAAWNWSKENGVGFSGKEVYDNPVDAIESLPSTPRAREITPREYQQVFGAI